MSVSDSSASWLQRHVPFSTNAYIAASRLIECDEPEVMDEEETRAYIDALFQALVDLRSVYVLATYPQLRIAEAVEAALAEERQRLRELADDFESNIDWSSSRDGYRDNEAWQAAATQLRSVTERGEA